MTHRCGGGRGDVTHVSFDLCRLALFVGCLVSSVATPAWACGCGAYIPDQAGAYVADERALGWPTFTWLSTGAAPETAGFPHPDGLDEDLAPFIADRWEIVAIQLAPAEAGESLTGDLQPLRLSFTSVTVVYPMRLSRSATTPQTVDLYVLADHRMDPKAVPVAGQQASLEFAGRVERSDASPALAAYADDGAFRPAGTTTSASRRRSTATTCLSWQRLTRHTNRSSTAHVTAAMSPA